MKPRYCYWSAVEGEHTAILEATIASARRVGVFKDFHVWSDRPVDGAISHKLGHFEKWGWLFKLTYLRDAASVLNYDYLIWLDADTWFVRHPGDPLRVMRGSPVHVTLERDLATLTSEQQWWGCPVHEFVQLVRQRGVTHRSVFSTNTGFFIVHHDVIETFFNLAFEFWHFCERQGRTLVDEPLFVYAMQMLCGDPLRHTLTESADLWASDWTGIYQDSLPDGKPWTFIEPFTSEAISVNPAIVHAMRSKSALRKSV